LVHWLFVVLTADLPVGRQGRKGAEGLFIGSFVISRLVVFTADLPDGKQGCKGAEGKLIG